jgi:hypothetical protein
MDARVFILTLPSLAVLGVLVAHSLKALPRPRAIVFWISVVAYGLLRGLALRFVMGHGGGTSFPYVIKNPLLPVLGVPFQELAGWAIVSYLAWWLGSRISRRVFVQIGWGCLFLGAISWAVESAAVAAGWWSWTVPASSRVFAGVPPIAIVDWLFVGFDFLFPFVVLTAPAFRNRTWRWLSLLTFPFHFFAHSFSGARLGVVPVHHAAHWALVALLIALMLRSEAEDDAFGASPAVLPLAGLAIVLLDASIVEVFVVKRPALLVSLIPAFLMGVVALRRSSLAWRPSRFAPAAVLGVAALAYVVHEAGVRGQAELLRRLDAALAARDHGDIQGAARELRALGDDFPGSHVPPSLLGEIDYRVGLLDEARASFERVVAIKQDDAKAFRYLAVIDLRKGKRESAGGFASRGLAVAPHDPELSYLAARARGEAGAPELDDPQLAQTLASLAFEVGDEAVAAAILDRGLDRWPEQRSFYPSRVNLALKNGDDAGVRRVVASWRARFPEDAEARSLSQRLGIE